MLEICKCESLCQALPLVARDLCLRGQKIRPFRT
jgi:hypothetical protein